jgi:hypothetical protein
MTRIEIRCDCCANTIVTGNGQSPMKVPFVMQVQDKRHACSAECARVILHKAIEDALVAPIVDKSGVLSLPFWIQIER